MSRIRILGVVLAAAAGSGCLVHVDHVADPGEAFREARREASRARGESGTPSHLNLLAYDPGEEELVRIELPLWLARKVCDDEAFEIDLDRRQSRRARELRGRVTWKDIEEAGAGILLEVEEDDDERVLVWLR
jgi:hypothetical protein